MCLKWVWIDLLLLNVQGPAWRSILNLKVFAVENRNRNLNLANWTYLALHVRPMTKRRITVSLHWHLHGSWI